LVSRERKQRINIYKSTVYKQSQKKEGQKSEKQPAEHAQIHHRNGYKSTFQGNKLRTKWICAERVSSECSAKHSESRHTYATGEKPNTLNDKTSIIFYFKTNIENRTKHKTGHNRQLLEWVHLRPLIDAIRDGVQ